MELISLALATTLAMSPAPPPPVLATLPAEAKVRQLTVDCDSGDTLAKALSKNGDLLEIQVTGTCDEPVLIDRSFVTLEGSGGATLGRGLTITDAVGITLRNLTVTNPAGDAIRAVSRSSVVVDSVDASGSARNGFSWESSTGLFSNATANGNALNGFSFLRSSDARFGGAITADDNAGQGVVVSGSSNLTAIAANIVTDGNENGFVVQLTSSAFLLAGSLQANDNNVLGILSATGGAITDIFAGVEASQNGLIGLAITGNGGYYSVTGSSRTFMGNGLSGIRVEVGSSLDLILSTTTIQNNGQFGLVLDGTSARLDGMTVTGNPDGDVVVDFIARADFVELTPSTVGTLLCSPDSAVRNAPTPCAALSPSTLVLDRAPAPRDAGRLRGPTGGVVVTPVQEDHGRDHGPDHGRDHGPSAP